MWVIADFQSRIEPSTIRLPKATDGKKTEETIIIKIKMHWDLVSATSNIYELNVQTIKNGKPEEFLQMMKDFKTGIDRTETTSATEKIQI